MPGLGNSVIFVLWNIDSFGGREHFDEAVGGLSEFVRGTPRASGVNAITLPGDPERQSRQRRTSEGIPIPDGTWALLTKLAAELGVGVPA
jgi:hydroxycarboxylate dehydrogenase B